jgi:gamma-glutamyltranspeptidase/glutathione hydrolase
MKPRILISRFLYPVAFTALLALGSCQSPGHGNTAPQDSLYSEKHLDFKAWNGSGAACSAEGSRAAVASGGTAASAAGLAMYQLGGNAIDAAVATAFTLAVERPHSAGLGGGGLMTIHLNGTPPTDVFVDFRETAPAKATRDMYLDADGKVIPHRSVKGALSIATPSFVAGLYRVQRKWGKLPWATDLGPAIRLAREGFPIYPSLADAIAREKDRIAADPGSRKILFSRSGPLKEGETLKQPDLAMTLERIATGGEDELRVGITARRIASFVQASHGILTSEDLKRYTVELRSPIAGRFLGFDYLTAPPPSAGGVILAETLNVLSGMDLANLVTDPVRYLHTLAEILKHGYADRAGAIGDPDFFKGDYTALMSPEHAATIRVAIGDRATPASEIRGASAPPVESLHTTHLSVIDAQGNAVASTITINTSFGADLVAPGTGIFLNDEMDDFSVKPGEPNSYNLTGGDANAIAGLKRPVSSMMPTIVLRGGQPVLAVGAAGGSRIISSVIQIVLNDLVVYPYDVRRAVFAPRLHDQWLPDKLFLEGGFPESIEQALRAEEYPIERAAHSAVAQAVGRDTNGKLTAVTDPRDEGGAAAY